MPLTRPSVLILSTNPAFARELAAHWPNDPNRPEFIVLEEGLFRDLVASHYDLAIADASSSESHSEMRQALAAAGKPAILIHADSSLPFLRTEGSTIELRGRGNEGERASEEGREKDGVWPALSGLLGREILRRSQAEARARDADTLNAAAQAEATLGRYMVEMRHNVNNALTSVLGNAELLTLEPGVPANAIAQADTILNMALRLHEIFQRFSSIEKELSVAARETGKKATEARAVSSGK